MSPKFANSLLFKILNIRKYYFIVLIKIIIKKKLISSRKAIEAIDVKIKYYFSSFRIII
jgi:hypothetical protein